MSLVYLQLDRNSQTHSSFTTKHHGTWHEFGVWIRFDAIEQSDNMQTVQQLTFVFVETFHVDVVHRSRIDLNSELILYELSHTQLVLLKNV